MSEYKYNIGDKVIVKPVESCDDTGIISYLGRMEKYAGKATTITERLRNCGKTVYRLTIDSGEYVWVESWLYSNVDLKKVKKNGYKI